MKVELYDINQLEYIFTNIIKIWESLKRKIEDHYSFSVGFY